LLDGSVVLDEGDFRSTLVKLIHEQLNVLQPNDRTALLASMTRYFDTNPRLSELVDPTRAFLAVSDPSYLRQAALSQPG